MKRKEKTCSICYSNNVLELTWVNPNTNEISTKSVAVMVGNDLDYCDNCKDYVRLDMTQINTHVTIDALKVAEELALAKVKEELRKFNYIYDENNFDHIEMMNNVTDFYFEMLTNSDINNKATDGKSS